MRLRTVIFGMYVASSALGFALLMAIVLWEVRPRYVESMRRTMQETAGILALMLEARMEAVGEGSEEAAVAQLWKDELRVLQKAAGSLRVYVTDRSGRVLADSNAGMDLGKDYTRRPEITGLLKRGEPHGESIDLVAGELRVVAPVQVRGETLAIVGVGRRLSSVQQYILGARIKLLVESLLVALLSLGAGWWVASRVAQSIERLTLHVRNVRDGKAEAWDPSSRALEIAELARAFEEMREALEGKAYVEHYTQSLAHEIKSPLSSIRGAAELLAEDPPPEARKRFLENLRSESERLRQIVDRLLQLSSVEARRGRHERESFDLRLLALEIADHARSSGEAHGKTLRVTSGDPLPLLGERFLIQQAVDNLVQNALEFAPDGSEILIAVRLEGSLAVLEVEDGGPGIPDFALPRIFERFYSLPRPSTGRKSTGLGLSLVREVARLHGGDAELVNRPGGGARASFRIPALNG